MAWRMNAGCDLSGATSRTGREMARPTGRCAVPVIMAATESSGPLRPGTLHAYREPVMPNECPLAGVCDGRIAAMRRGLGRGSDCGTRPEARSSAPQRLASLPEQHYPNHRGQLHGCGAGPAPHDRSARASCGDWKQLQGQLCTAVHTMCLGVRILIRINMVHVSVRQRRLYLKQNESSCRK